MMTDRENFDAGFTLAKYYRKRKLPKSGPTNIGCALYPITLRSLANAGHRRIEISEVSSSEPLTARFIERDVL